MFTRETFLKSIETYLTASGMSATGFGRQVLRDPMFVFELRSGRSPGLDIVERVVGFMRDNPPSKRRKVA